MCAGCWDVRTRAVGLPAAERSSTALQTAGLVLGGLALFPFPAMQLSALVIGLLGLFMAKSEAARRVRWRSGVGLALTAVGLGVDLLLFVVLPGAR